MKEALDGKLLISILAGVSVAQLAGWTLPSTKIVRAMPNTPCQVRHALLHFFFLSFSFLFLNFTFGRLILNRFTDSRGYDSNHPASLFYNR